MQGRELEIDALSMPELSIDYCIAHPEDRHYLLTSNHRIREMNTMQATWNGGASQSFGTYEEVYRGQLYLTIPGYESCRAFGGNYYEWPLTMFGTGTRTVTSTASGPGTGNPPPYSGTDTYTYSKVVGRVEIAICGGLNIGEVIWWWYYFTRFRSGDTSWEGCVLFEPVIRAIGKASWCG